MGLVVSQNCFRGSYSGFDRFRHSLGKQIGIGLNKVLASFNEKIEADYNFKEQIVQFRNGCSSAIKQNKIIEFH